MARYLIDTNIVRFYIEEQKQVTEFLNQCKQNNDTLLLSMVTVGELQSQLFEIKPKYRPALRNFIKAFPKIEATDPEDRKAHAYRRMARAIRTQHAKEKKGFQPRLPELADSKIAIDAINEKIPIITHNTKDFHIARFFGISLYNPIKNIWFHPINKTNGSPPKFILPNHKYD